MSDPRRQQPVSAVPGGKRASAFSHYVQRSSSSSCISQMASTPNNLFVSSARAALQLKPVSSIDADHDDVEVSQLMSSLVFDDAFLENTRVQSSRNSASRAS